MIAFVLRLKDILVLKYGLKLTPFRQDLVGRLRVSFENYSKYLIKFALCYKIVRTYTYKQSGSLNNYVCM